MSSRRKAMRTKRSMIVQPACCWFKELHGCSDCRLRFAISAPKDTLNTICEKSKEVWYYFSITELFPLPFRFKVRKYLLRKKICNYPLTTLQGGHYASYENIVSQSQTSSLHPHRCTFSLDFVFRRKEKPLNFSS